jgi:hypothetical protein
MAMRHEESERVAGANSLGRAPALSNPAGCCHHSHMWPVRLRHETILTDMRDDVNEEGYIAGAFFNSANLIITQHE